MKKNTALYKARLKRMIRDGAGGPKWLSKAYNKAADAGDWLRSKGKETLKKIMAPKTETIYNYGDNKYNPVFNQSTGESRNTNPGLSSADQKRTDEAKRYANQVQANNRNRSDNGSAPVLGTPNKAPSSVINSIAEKNKDKPQEVYQPPTSTPTSAPEDTSGLTIVIKPGTLAARHNNPGNLTYVGQAGATKGEPKEGGGYWAKFASPLAGYEALKNQVKLDQSRGQTIEDFVNKYAPKNENDTEQYIQNLSRKLGVERNALLTDFSPSIIAKWLAFLESGTTIS